jgi:hypothetical protein
MFSEFICWATSSDSDQSMGAEASVIKITFLMYFNFLQYFMMRSRPTTSADMAPS